MDDRKLPVTFNATANQVPQIDDKPIVGHEPTSPVFVHSVLRTPTSPQGEVFPPTT